MLPTNLVRVRQVKNRIVPQYLDASADSWRDMAEQVLEVFHGRIGAARGEIDADLEEMIGNHPATLLFQGLAKLVEDRCEFEVVAGHPPAALREQVFLAAARQRQSDPFDRAAVLAGVAQELALTSEQVDQGMLADLKSEQRLIKFDDINVTHLIERYNVALAQAVLLRSTGVTVTVRGESPPRLRQLFRAIKFHRLICDADQGAAGAVTLRLDGPMSLFSATQKYGLQLAMFLPTLLHCDHFELQAEVRWGVKRVAKIFALSSADGLRSPTVDRGSYTPPDLQMFVELFRKKIDDWDIQEEADVLPLGRGFWVPDYRLTHRKSKKFVYLEVLGFWRKGAVEGHLKRLRQHAGQPFVLAVSDQLKIDDEELAELPAGVLRFRTMPVPDEVVRLAGGMLVLPAPKLVPNISDSPSPTSFDAAPVKSEELEASVRQPRRRKPRKAIAIEFESSPSDTPVRPCVGCGRPISPERLEVIPEATRCVTCQQRTESTTVDWRFSEVVCPRCSDRGIKSPMVWRTARDPTIQGYFLGCSLFPECQYIDRS